MLVNMQQEFVIEVRMACEKCRSNALKAAVSGQGVGSVKIIEEGNKLQVIGENMDAVDLTQRLKKRLGHAKLLSVRQMRDDDDDEAQMSSGRLETVWPIEYGVARPIVYEYYNPNHNGCSIF
ncbi:hypothetical protein AMTRI_Chr10g232890 [Amborella trichopoda]